MPDWLSWSTFLTAIAGLIAIGAAIVSGIEQTREAQADNKILKELNEKNQQVISLLGQLDEKNQQVIAAQDETLRNYTGGDSFAYLHFANLGTAPMAYFATVGEHPSYLLILDCMNLMMFAERVGKPDGKILPAEHVTVDQERCLPAHRTSIFQKFAFPEKDKSVTRYLVWLNLRNGEYFQVVQMIRGSEGSPLKYAYNVYRVTGHNDGRAEFDRTPVLHYADKGYPVDENGNIEWLDYPDIWGKLLTRLGGGPELPSTPAIKEALTP